MRFSFIFMKVNCWVLLSIITWIVLYCLLSFLGLFVEYSMLQLLDYFLVSFFEFSEILSKAIVLKLSYKTLQRTSTYGSSSFLLTLKFLLWGPANHICHSWTIIHMLGVKIIGWGSYRCLCVIKWCLIPLIFTQKVFDWG